MMPTKAYKTKRAGIIEPEERDWARAAAYIDGEGCISTSTAINKKKNSESIYVTVSVHNTDPRLIDWFVERFGGRIWKTVHGNADWQNSYGWRLTCQQAREFLEQCLPWFLIKREQAELAISLMKTFRRWGSGGMPDQIKEQRWEMRNKLSEMKGLNSRITGRNLNLYRKLNAAASAANLQRDFS